MNRPHLALAALLLFSSYTAWTMAIADQSLLAFGLELLSRPDTAQVVIDLYLLGAMAGTWIYRDARARGYSWVSMLPYLALTMVFLSIGPLLYIVTVGYRGQRRKVLKARASDSATL
ncbi:DUF2834 domain-containing protein [Pseudomonas sp. BMW13]|uniref:DUF2834 domain-containing protein n=1 Tax=Pseudomonas sp. BMW13 TaxID=2562590 RepID=UPI001582FE83|nr:DUF2834 domain-containing protein [Pseudomonas sp. BMW13]